MTVDQFQSRVRELALGFPLSVTSWGRSAARNKAVGGHPNSWHRLWRGMDVVLDDGREIPEFTKRAIQLGIEVINEGDHLHLQGKP